MSRWRAEAQFAADPIRVGPEESKFLGLLEIVMAFNSSNVEVACPSSLAGQAAVRVVRVLSVVSFIVVAGCAASRGGPVPYDVQGFGAPDAPAVARLEEDYRIAPLDTLIVNVFNVPDLSREYEVDLTGNLSLPLIGSVKAIDKTPRELQAELVSRYHPNYLRNPDISVGVKASTRSSVTLDGAVRQPGMYPVTGTMTLLQAIATARGTDENANPRRVAVFRVRTH